MDFPWLESARAQFARLSLNLPHALLVYGPPGLAKHTLAMEMVASLLCEASIATDSQVQVCGRCKSCRMFESHNHPDFHYLSSEQFVAARPEGNLVYAHRYLEPEEKRGKRKPRKVITVDQVRGLIDSFALSSHSASHKVALIEPAEAMNINASNALLKLLEEPTAGSVLILVCNDLSRLPMTIRSRCIAVAVDSPDDDQVLAWLGKQGLSETTARKALAIASGAPLVALEYAQSDKIEGFEQLVESLAALLRHQLDPVEVREILLKQQSLPVLLAWMQRLVNWLIRCSREGEASRQAPWRGYQRQFSDLSRSLGTASQAPLFELYDELLGLRRQDLDVVNPAMVLDKWLISFSRRLA